MRLLRAFFDFLLIKDRALAAPAGEHVVDRIGDEEAGGVALIALGEQTVIVGMAVPDMAAERQPERRRRRQRLHLGPAGQRQHRLGIGQRNARHERPQRFANRLLPLGADHGRRLGAVGRKGQRESGGLPLPLRESNTISCDEGLPIGGPIPLKGSRLRRFGARPAGGGD